MRLAPLLPVPFGVVAVTGETRPLLSDALLREITLDPPSVLARARRAPVLAPDGELDDPTDLSHAGWCIVFPTDVDAGVREALTPLVDWRRAQVGDERRFKVFEGSSGVRPGQSAAAWAAARGVSLSAPVSARRGVPYYVLLAGSPAQIPFEFQAQLDLQWAVGRVFFEHAGEYASYASKVIAAEKGVTRARAKSLAIWLPRNPLDLATPLLAGSVVPELLGQTSPGDTAVGHTRGFEVATFVGDGRATKETLAEIMRGRIDAGPPSLLFTGSHGVEWPMDVPERQRARQGALVTQEWTRGQPLTERLYFSAADVPNDADVEGLIMFLFACFGGGCPERDSYYAGGDGTPLRLAPEPLVARLPQVLLARGALAVIAHVDRAFSYAFEDIMGTPQAQLLRAPLELLARGQRVGLATDPLNLQWSTLAAQLGLALQDPSASSQSALIANLTIARDDARNYAVLGDPAVRLRSAGSS